MAIGTASKEWRDSLLKEIVVPELSQSFDIKKYYDFASRLFDQAEAYDMKNEFAYAYIMYKKYAKLGSDVICKHNYYKHYKVERDAFNRQFAVAVDRLEHLVQRMDEEAAHHAARLRAHEANRQAALAKAELEARARALEEQRRAREQRARAEQLRALEEEGMAEAARRSSQAREAERREAEARRDHEARAAALASASASALALASAAPTAAVSASSAVLSCRSLSSDEAVYTHADGREEVVRVLRAHSEAEGGGYTVLVPSLGDRERQTVASRIRFKDDDLAGDNADLLDLATGDTGLPSRDDPFGSAGGDDPWGGAGELLSPSAPLTERGGGPEAFDRPPSAPPAEAPRPAGRPGGSAASAPFAAEAEPPAYDSPEAPTGGSAAYQPTAPPTAPPAYKDSPKDRLAPGTELSLADSVAEAAAMAAAAMTEEATPPAPLPAAAPGAPSAPPAAWDPLPPPTGAPPPAVPVAGEGSSSGRTHGASSYQAFGLSLRALRDELKRAWDSHLASGRATVDPLQTYQGRTRTRGGLDSTNGCTVIAPLVGYRHLTWHDPHGQGRGLPSSHIEHVIDHDCPPLLAEIRHKYSLPPGAFAVPADVHDHLFDRKLLEERFFGGVHGGNCLDEEHMGAMVETLEGFPRGHKAAVCFFFREHVCAVLKLACGAYEVVDSLPHAPYGMGVRIRCSGAEVLRACLAWYCTSKFSQSQLDFLDANPWDEATAELDPRIFQGHVWHSGS